MQKPTISQLIADIKAGKEVVLVQLYETYHDEFMKWAQRHYALDKEDLEEVYQDVMLIFYKNVQQGKLQNLHVSLKTYLFAIGKNQMSKKLRKKTKIVNLEQVNIGEMDNILYHKIEQTHQQYLVQQALGQLGAACQKLLRLFYFNNFSGDAIAREMNYSDESSMRVRKVQCLKQLKKLLSNDKTIT